MKNPKDTVREYFDKKSEDFDSIYSGNKNFIGRYLDKKLRWDMEERLQKTIRECQNILNKTIIDIGCGSGRFIEALQVKSPKLLVGIDYAPNMISIAKKRTESKKSFSNPILIIGDFKQLHFKSVFDIVLGIGLFDYVEEPLPILVKMRGITKEKIITTFPRKGTFRAFIRRIRLRLNSCPVYFYSLPQVEHLIEEAGFSIETREIFGQLIFITAK